MMSLYFNTLPKIEELSDINIYDDVFICTVGFEERTKAALSYLLNIGYKCKYSFVIKYDSENENNKKYENEINIILKKITIIEKIEFLYNMEKLELKINNEDANLVIQKLFNDKKIKDISFDISSCSTGLIIQTLDLLFRSDLEHIRIIYTSGRKYPDPNVPLEKDRYTITTPYLKRIKSLNNFSGIYTPGYSPLYIFVLGFDPIRAVNVLRKYQPAKKIGLLGEPSTDDFMYRLELQQKIYKNLFSSHDEIDTSSSFNYIDTYKKLESIYDKYCEYNNIIIVPLGSKMQTLAVFFLLENYPDIKLLLPILTYYDPDNYAEGIGKIYEINYEIKKEIL